MTGDEALVSTGAAADDLGLTVTVGAANKVMIATQASTTAIISTAFGTQPVVNITDTYGNTVTGSSATATATVYSDSSCANAAGGYFPNNSATASSGVATFSGLQYSETGAVYLGFASTGITAACGGTSSTVLSPASTSSVTVGGGSGGSDTTAPAAPTGIAVTTSAGKVVITWTDPSDPDLFAIEILRGVGALPVSGTAYDSVGKGVQTYTDTAVSAGDVVKYILRSKDSSSNTSISSEYSITVAAGTTSTVTTTTTTTTTTPVTTTTTTAPVTTTTTTTTQNRYQQAGVSESEVDSAVGSFSDLLKDAWHAPFIARMKNLAILAGYPDGTVQPDRTINRAELAKIATKASNLSTGGERFVDVPGDSWFAPFVGALQSAGAAWTTTANYQPGGDVTRGEALWTLLTAAGVDLDGVTVTKIFPDVSTRHRFAAAITYASQNGIVSGYDNGNFGPGDTLTRGQVAKIVSLIKDL
jgi:hypothetical protein